MNKLKVLMHIIRFIQQLSDDPKEKMDGLKRKLKDLESREDDITSQLNYEESFLGKKRRKLVHNWLTYVAEKKAQFVELEHKVEQGNMYNRFQLLSGIKRFTAEVTQLSERVFLDGLTFEAHGSQGLELPTTELVGETFQDKKKMILNLLINNGVSCVGIFGMGGIGKTMLLTHLHNKLLNMPNTSVYFVTVSQVLDIETLQSDIARAFGVDLRNEKEEKIRAAIIAQALKTRQDDAVLLLDDLWTAFCLKDIGICPGGKCKIIFATRSLEVCDRMHCEKVELLPLDDKEAWKLFQTELGDATKLTPQLEDIAKRVVRECAGLPLGIVAMARSLRGVDDAREWSNALEAMTSHHAEVQDQDDEGLKKVFGVLMYSFDALDKTSQECFLYCSLFPKDCKIRRDALITYLIDEGLIQGMRNKEAFNSGYRILSGLARVCLLQGGPNWKYLKMHDLVREMAIRIASKKYPSWVEDRLTFFDMSNQEKWQVELKRVSFVGRYVADSLSSASPPKCPEISTFLLRDSYNVTMIPDSFFDHMTTLTILDLSRTGISNLPSSVSNLKSLTTLLLASCQKIERVVSLAKLTALKRLDLSGTGIPELPEGIEMLTELRELNLHGAKRLGMIPEGVLCKLTRLQHLLLPKLRIGPALAEEIGGLRALERFKVEYFNTKDLDAILRSWRTSNPDEYILLGDEVLCRDLNDVSEETNRHISIKKCHELGTLCELGSLKNARGLRTCYVGECDRMVHLFCQDCFDLPFSQSLEIMCLESLSLRELIGEGRCESSPRLHQRQRHSSTTFSRLKGFRMYKCPKIEKLFTLSLLLNLESLETLKVCDSANLVEIVQHHEEDANNSVEISSLHKLKQLKLWGLPQLKSFCESRKMVSPSLEEIDIADCPKLESLPLVSTSSNFCALKELTIKRCHNIKTLFTLTLTSSLENLEKLFIHNCEELVEIVQALNSSTDQTINALPKLKVLKMQSLPRLECFSQSRRLVSDSVEEISIINCPNLRRFPLLRDELKHPMSLKRITVEDEWWELVEFEHPNTKGHLNPMCDFRRRFYGQVSHLG